MARPRAVAPLPPGPRAVPVSTLDWLLSREDLAARYVTLRDILGRPEKDIERRRAFREVPRDPWVRDVLVLLRKRLAPGWTAAGLSHPYDGVLWQALFLCEMGLDRRLPELERVADVLWAGWERDFVRIDRGEDPVTEPQTLLVVFRTLAALGPGDDPRLLSAARWVAERRLGSADAPRGGASVAPELRFLAAVPAGSRLPLVERALAFAVERAIATELPSGRELEPPLLGALPERHADLLELLSALAGAGVTRRPELEPALSLLVHQADRRSRWKLDRGPDGPTWIERERIGELSRWVTVKALGALSRLTGLTMTGGR